MKEMKEEIKANQESQKRKLAEIKSSPDSKLEEIKAIEISQESR